MKKIILLLSSFCFMSISQAQVKSYPQISKTTENIEYESWYNRIKPFLGINAGYTTKESHINSEGLPANIKLIGSYLFSSETGLIDLGLGFSNQSFSDKNAIESYKNGSVLEAAYRYQWGNKIQAGLVLNDFFKQGQNYGAVQADAQFGGIQVVKEFVLKSTNLARFGFKALTELNPATRHYANMALIDFQLSFGADRSQGLVQESWSSGKNFELR